MEALLWLFVFGMGKHFSDSLYVIRAQIHQSNFNKPDQLHINVWEQNHLIRLILVSYSLCLSMSFYSHKLHLGLLKQSHKQLFSYSLNWYSHLHILISSSNWTSFHSAVFQIVIYDVCYSVSSLKNFFMSGLFLMGTEFFPTGSDLFQTGNWFTSNCWRIYWSQSICLGLRLAFRAV